jgi:hypothetical protein
MKSLTAILALAIPLAAHHSMAGFDRNKSVTLSGTVKQFKWANPHAWIEMEVATDKGPQMWNFEMTAPAQLIRAGWKSSSLRPGDKVSITARPQVNGEPGGLFVSVTLADGKVLTERPQPAPGAPKPEAAKQ